MLTLYRYRLTENLTQGLLLQDGRFLADVLELPWNNNARYVSCIPEGHYKINWNTRDHEWPCYEFEEVADRDGILIHPANTVSDLEGCLALGQKWGDGLWHSALTLAKVHDMVGSSSALLITSVFGS